MGAGGMMKIQFGIPKMTCTVKSCSLSIGVLYDHMPLLINAQQLRSTAVSSEQSLESRLCKQLPNDLNPFDVLLHIDYPIKKKPIDRVYFSLPSGRFLHKAQEVTSFTPYPRVRIEYTWYL